MGKGVKRMYVFSSTADIYRHTNYDFAQPKNVRKIDMEMINRIKDAQCRRHVTSSQEVIVKKSAVDKRLEPQWIVIVLDDYKGNADFNLVTKVSRIVSQLAVSGRHYKICTIILTQHPNMVPQ